MRCLAPLQRWYRARRRLRGVPDDLPPYLMRDIGLEPRAELRRLPSTLHW